MQDSTCITQILFKHTKNSKWEMGQNVSVLFVVPVIIDLHGHAFEIFTFGI